MSVAALSSGSISRPVRKFGRGSATHLHSTGRDRKPERGERPKGRDDKAGGAIATVVWSQDVRGGGDGSSGTVFVGIDVNNESGTALAGRVT